MYILKSLSSHPSCFLFPFCFSLFLLRAPLSTTMGMRTNNKIVFICSIILIVCSSFLLKSLSSYPSTILTHAQGLSLLYLAPHIPLSHKSFILSLLVSYSFLLLSAPLSTMDMRTNNKIVYLQYYPYCMHSLEKLFSSCPSLFPPFSYIFLYVLLVFQLKEDIYLPSLLPSLSLRPSLLLSWIFIYELRFLAS